MIKYEGYLTEDKLGEILIQIFPDVVKQYRLKNEELGRTFIIDYYIPSKKMLVEYNGDRHYTKAKTLLRDRVLGETYSSEYKIVSIPYWMQLDSQTLEYYFGIKNVKISNTFPHGFWTKKCVLPSDFCPDGINFFVYEMVNLLKLDKKLFLQVRQSLFGRHVFQPIEEVFGVNPPDAIKNLIELVVPDKNFVFKSPCPDCYDIYLTVRKGKCGKHKP